MSWPALLRRVRYLIRRDAYAADLEEEMRIHMQMREEALRAKGMSAADAKGAARRQFGNVTARTEESRDMWGFESFDTFRRDLFFASRRLRQRPAFSIPVITVLALGIGATTAVFSAVDAAMLRSLPFPAAHQLYTLPNVNIPFQREFDRSPGELLSIVDVAGMGDVFSSAAAYAAGGLNLMDDERPLRVDAGVVTTTFFSTLGVRPLHGRGFTAEEGKPNGPRVVVLSHRLWQSQYGGGEILGRAIRLHGRPHTVVGIMPPGFDFPKASQLWIPLPVPTTFDVFEPFRGFLPSTVVARTRAGVPDETVKAALLAAWERAVAPAEGEKRKGLDEWIAEVKEKGIAVPLQRDLLGDRRRALLVLLGATGLLLLIACANVANLLLSDAAIRRREIAVRGVLGATRGRVVRQLLVESTMLAVAGASLGVLLAPAVLKVLRSMLPATLAGVSPAQIDLRVLAFAALLAVATGIIFGLWPAVGASRADANQAIKGGGGHGATAGGVGTVRRALVVAEVALTVMLLIGAGLMLRSFEQLMSKDIGLNPEQVATLETSFPRSVPAPERLRIAQAALDRLAQQPGILAAGIVNDLPLRGGGGISVSMTVPDAAPLPEGERHFARQLSASGGYFDALGIRLLRGRTFTPTDNNDAAPVAIISNITANTWWPGREPIGGTFSYGPDGPPITVIGVVADVREGRMDREPTPQMYHSAYRAPPDNLAFVVRGTLPPSLLMTRLREAMASAAPGQPVYNVRMMDDVIGASVAPRRTNTILIGLFAALALALAALGVYAVVSYGVAQRTREFGIRAALGARGSDLVSLVAREMVGAIAAGLLLGLGAAWALSKVLASLLYEVDARDAVTFAVVPLVLVLPAIVATLIPAVRAMKVSPTEVMRAD
ncbi:MAG TPA: ABC transporter permease [Gemmatimonadaceae bacterium]|nr:ABC transporter permease [Gemmatimonadaceae bacterium]